MEKSGEKQAITATLLSKARHLCSMQEQCINSVKVKVISWGGTEAMAEEIVESLQSMGYLDEMRYAKQYCESKLLSQQWGRQKVLSGLRTRRVAPEAIAEGMAVVSDEEYYESLERLARKKMALLEGDEDHRKLRLFLKSRGFCMDEINTVITNILQS